MSGSGYIFLGGETVEYDERDGSYSFPLATSGYAECGNGHSVHWWSADGEAPDICDQCGARWQEKPSPLSIKLDYCKEEQAK